MFIEVETRRGKMLLNTNKIVSIKEGKGHSIVTLDELEEEDGIVTNAYEWVTSPSYKELKDQIWFEGRV